MSSLAVHAHLGQVRCYLFLFLQYLLLETCALEIEIQERQGRLEGCSDAVVDLGRDLDTGWQMKVALRRASAADDVGAEL